MPIAAEAAVTNDDLAQLTCTAHRSLSLMSQGCAGGRDPPPSNTAPLPCPSSTIDQSSVTRLSGAKALADPRSVLR